MAHLNLLLLGSPIIELNGVQTKVATRKTIALLTYLAVSQQRHSRDLLTNLLWPDSTPKRGRASLRRALADIKKAVGEGWFIMEQDHITINPEANITSDVHTFQQIIREQDFDQFAQAIELYRDDFMAGFNLYGAGDFDEWLYFERDTLRQTFIQALEDLVQWHIANDTHAEAIPYGRRLVTCDPLHETAHVQLMKLYAKSGQRAAALRQYDTCQRIFMEELAVEPSPSTTRLHEQIKQQNYEEKAHPKPRPRRKKTNLPDSPTSFVGRETEIAQISETLANPNARLVTIFGLGGVGKTRLALQVGRAHLNAFKDGVWFIDLTAIQSPQAIITAIAQSLSIPLRGLDTPLEQVQQSIQNKEMLWLFDNFEHLVEGASILSELLSHAPHLKILVTSRTVLDLAEEWLYQVDGLSYPVQQPSSEPTGLPALPSSAAFSAVYLFIQRARQTQQSFEYLPQQADVHAICQIVEGLPLAIELAAVWVRLLSCEQIAAQIKQNLDFLATSHRNITDRHRSIRAVFDYSWQLLTPTEQQALAMMSVFRGTFTAEAALAVADVSLFALYSLHNKSLLRANNQGDYELHELLRQFAAEKLPDAEHVQTKHMQFYTTLLHESEPMLFGGEQTATLERIGREITNVYQAWLWAAEKGRFTELNEAFHTLYNYHAMRSLYYQGEQILHQTHPLLEPFLDIAEQEAIQLIVRLMTRRGKFLYVLNKLSAAKDCLDHALSLASQLDLIEQKMLAVQSLGVVLYLQGRFAEAKERLTQALELATEHHNRHRQAYVYMTLGALEQALGNLERAQNQHQLSLAIYQELGYQWGIANALKFLGISAYHLNDYERAKSFFDRSLEISQTLNTTIGIAVIYNWLGKVSEALGNPPKALQLHQQSLKLAQESHVYLTQAQALQSLGRTFTILEQHQRGYNYLHQALTIAIKTEATPLILDILADWTNLLEGSGLQQESSALVGAILEHPASNWETQKKAKQVWQQLSLPRGSSNALVNIEDIDLLDIIKQTMSLSIDE